MSEHVHMFAKQNAELDATVRLMARGVMAVLAPWAEKSTPVEKHVSETLRTLAEAVDPKTPLHKVCRAILYVQVLNPTVGVAEERALRLAADRVEAMTGMEV